MSQEAARILALLAEPARLRVASALILGATSVDELVPATGLPVRDIEKALARLSAGGLLVRDGSHYRFLTEELTAAARTAAHERDARELAEAPEGSDVLRRFVKGGRLESIPAARSKLRVVLDYLAQDFEPGRRYSEREVNELLKRHHDDVASLRRYLVDEEFMERAGGEYWRAGGTFRID